MFNRITSAILVAVGLMSAQAATQPEARVQVPKTKRPSRTVQPGSQYVGTYRSKYLPHQGQREALRRYRRAQGGPGIELVGERTRHPVWQPRG